MRPMAWFALTLGLCASKEFLLRVTVEDNQVKKIEPLEDLTVDPETDEIVETPCGATIDPNTESVMEGAFNCTNGMNVNWGSTLDGEGQTKNGVNVKDLDGIHEMKGGPIIRIEKMTNGYALEVEKVTAGGSEDPLGQCQSWVNTPTVNLWATSTKAILYLLALMWIFLGVAIVADVFMASIEEITSETVAVQMENAEGNMETVYLQRWNDTVANLTLMALGSSAPEILLAVLETLGTLGQVPGELGPSTIVGSAAYNLFVITGVCMISVPPADDDYKGQENYEGETGIRDISELNVFYVTAFFSVFAYVWMLICLLDNKVEVWEALITFAFFPILVGIAYYFDVLGQAKREAEEKEAGAEGAYVKGADRAQVGTAATSKVLYIKGRGERVDTLDTPGFSKEMKNTLSPEEVAALKADKEADDYMKKREEAAEMIAAQMALKQANNPNKKKSKMFWRVQAGKAAQGKPSAFDTIQKQADKAAELMDAQADKDTEASTSKSSGPAEYSGAKDSQKVFEFDAHEYPHKEPKEEPNHVTVWVHRNGPIDKRDNVMFRTVDGTAKAGEQDEDGADYKAKKDVLKFAEGVRSMKIEVEIFPDKKVEATENFTIELYSPDNEEEVLDSTTILIIDTSSPGTFKMRKDLVDCIESAGTVKVFVQRFGGNDGTVEIKYKTEEADVSKKDDQVQAVKDGDQKEGDEADYEAVDGVLRFEQGVSGPLPIEIKIIDNSKIDGKIRVFAVVLTEAKLVDCDKAVEDTAIQIDHDKDRTNVIIHDDDDYSKFVELVQTKMQQRLDDFSIATMEWTTQFSEAIEAPPDDHLSPIAYLLHCLSLPWKVIMAFIPPTKYGGGWVCFCTSLAATGMITAVVAEFAAMFGCMVGMPEPAVALTVVALGTSLPDTFASQLAIMYSKDADSAVGNVTGSNSVNVFLGLGLPWTIAAFYYAGEPKDYIVPTGSLNLSVAVFAPMAILCLCSLMFNRWMIGGVVGGDPTYRWIWFCIYVGMWVGFLVIAISKPFTV